MKYYEIVDLVAGIYALAPSKPGWTFAPDTLEVSLDRNLDGQDFSGHMTGYRISGYAKNVEDSSSIQDVLVTLSGQDTTLWDLTRSDDGYYEFEELVTGDYTAVPSKQGWIFAPSSRLYEPLSTNREHQDFWGEFIGFTDGILQVRITAPPVKGKANKELIAFLSKSLGVNKSSLSIVKGHTSRNKVIAIDGLSQENVINRLSA